jgi:hypothetical protein
MSEWRHLGEAMKKKRFLTIGGCVVLAGVALGGWMYYSLSHFPISLTPTQVQAMQTAWKGSLGEAMFGNVQPQPEAVTEETGLDSVLASTPAPQGEGLISAYNKDPAKFKRYAQLYDTALNAKRVGLFVQANRSRYILPLSSSSLVLGDERLDAWGHPYCVIATKAGVAVVSRGEQPTSFDCERDIPSKEIAAARRHIFQTTSGQVAVIVGDSPALGQAGVTGVTSDWEEYTSTEFHVVFRHPKDWKAQPDGGGVSFGPPVQLGVKVEAGMGVSAADADNPEQICRNEATHKLRPFGSRPRIKPIVVDGRKGCIVWGSDDQPFPDYAEVVVTFPLPVVIKGDRYRLLTVHADKKHILDIIKTVKFVRE